MHAQQHCIAICLASVRCSCPVPPPSCGVAPGGPRPCRATQPFSPRCCTCIRSLFSLPSPPLCLLPALLVLFPRSVCSPLVVSAPWLYLARPHVPQGLRPVFRLVARPGRPPQTPLRGNSPVLLSRRPSLHQFPNGRAGRPVPLYAGQRQGASVRETLCSFAPSLAPCSPHLPHPATSICPSCVPARPAVVFFFWFSSLLAAPARPACAPLLFFVLPWSRCPAPPLPPVSPPILLLAVVPVCTSALPVRASLSLVCATRVPYPCPSSSPLPFHLGAPSVPASHPILAAWRPV